MLEYSLFSVFCVVDHKFVGSSSEPRGVFGWALLASPCLYLASLLMTNEIPHSSSVSFEKKI